MKVVIIVSGIPLSDRDRLHLIADALPDDRIGAVPAFARYLQEESDFRHYLASLTEEDVDVQTASELDAALRAAKNDSGATLGELEREFPR